MEPEKLLCVSFCLYWSSGTEFDERGDLSGEKAKSWGLGNLATWLGIMFAAEKRPLFLHQTSIHTSLYTVRTVRLHFTLCDRFLVPLRSITLSRLAERFPHNPFLYHPKVCN